MMGPGYGYGYGYDMMDGRGWFGGPLMLLFGALCIAAVVLIVLWAVRSSSAHHHPGGAAPKQPGATGHDEAVAIAKRRLATGEITAEQYAEIMRALGE